MTTRAPAELRLIRHAESAGNVARDRAHRARALTIDIPMRDVDVPLSPLGEQQATALGAWCRDHVEPVDAVLTSPYKRARETVSLALERAGWDRVPVTIDERLREKEFGVLDRLTRAGIERHLPDEAERRRLLGKFYYRPPGGESWADVILRLRGVLDMLAQQYAGQRVAIVSHQVIVLCFRYLLEGLTEDEILAIDREGDVANCSVTTYRSDPTSGRLALESYNVLAPMLEQGAPVTAEPDEPVARS